MTEPLRVRWDRTVIHSTGPGDDTIVCCLDQHGHPVALFLDDELREALGLQLLLPDGDGEVDPQHLELARENEKLRAELVDAEQRFERLHVDHNLALGGRDQARAELAELKKTPRERANDRVRALREAGDFEGAMAAAEAFEASEAYTATHPRY